MDQKQRAKEIIKGFAFPVGYFLFMYAVQTLLSVLLSLMISVRSTLALLTRSDFAFDIDKIMEMVNYDTLTTTMKYASFFSALTTAAALLILWLVFQRKGKSFAAYFSFTPAAPKAIIASILLGLSLHFIVNAVVLVTDPLVTQITEAFFKLVESILPSLGQWMRAYHQSANEMMEQIGQDVGMFTIVAVLGAPLIEELVFRAGPLNKFKGHMPVWLSLLLTSLMFAMAHSTPVQMAYTFFVGLTLGLLFIRSNSIYPAILAHFCFNGANLIPMAMEGLLGGPFQTDTMTAWLGTAYNLYTLVTCIIAIPMLAIGLILLFSLRPSMPKQTQQADQASTDEQVQNSDTTKEQEI